MFKVQRSGLNLQKCEFNFIYESTQVVNKTKFYEITCLIKGF